MLSELSLSLVLLVSRNQSSLVELVLKGTYAYANKSEVRKLEETDRDVARLSVSVLREGLAYLGFLFRSREIVAISYWGTIGRANPSHPEQNWSLASCLHHAGVKRAINVHRLLVAQEVRNHEGMVLLQSNQAPSRHTLTRVGSGGHEKTLDRGVRKPELLYEQAEVIIRLAHAGKLASSDASAQVSKAYRFLLQHLQMVPADGKVHNLMGLALAYLGNIEDSKRQFQKAVQLDPSNSDYAFNLASQYERQGEPQKGIELLKKAIVREPKSIEAYDRLVWLYLKTSRQDSEAERVLMTLVGLDPSRARSHLLAGNFYDRRGDLERAIRHYDAVVELEPWNFQGYFLKAIVQSGQGNVGGAESSLLKALNCNPSHADSLVELGKIYLLQGKVALAESIFALASKSNPSHAEVHFQLGTLYRKRGELEKARQELELYEVLRQRQSANRSVGVP